MPPLAKRPNRILVVRYRFIGDTLLTIPFLAALREAWPEAQIDVLVGPYSGEVLTHVPYVNELITFDTTRKHRYENLGEDGGGGPRSFWEYVGDLRGRKYDVAFVLKRSLSSAALAFFAGIPQRIGFNTEGRRLLLTRAVPYDTTRPEADCFLDLLRAIDLPVADAATYWNRFTADKPVLWAEPEEMMAAAMAEKYTDGPNVLYHLTSSNTAKQWPAEQATQLAGWLVNDVNATLHCLGASSDAPQYEALRQQLPEEKRHKLLNWCGHTSLLESLAFIRRMDAVVGVDSGTLHMAATVGVPVVSLFGPMDDRKWAPMGPHNQVVALPLPCRPCNLKRPCEINYQCMTELNWETVQAACRKVLNC